VNAPEPDSLPSSTVKVTTPDGVIFVHIIDHSVSGAPLRIDLSIGKAGSSIQAWAQALARVTTLALMNGANLGSIIEVLSAITTDRLTFSSNRAVRSGPDGIAQALIIYMASKSPTLNRKKRRRGPTFFGEEIER
jgi:hypothetical protein